MRHSRYSVNVNSLLGVPSPLSTSQVSYSFSGVWTRWVLDPGQTPSYHNYKRNVVKRSGAGALMGLYFDQSQTGQCIEDIVCVLKLIKDFWTSLHMHLFPSSFSYNLLNFIVATVLRFLLLCYPHSFTLGLTHITTQMLRTQCRLVKKWMNGWVKKKPTHYWNNS